MIVARRLLERAEVAAGIALAATPSAARRAVAGRRVEIDGQVLDREAQALARSSRLLGLDRDDLTPAQERSRARRGARLARGRAVAVGEVRALRVPGAAGELDARLYVPDAAPDLGPLLLYFHGGGYAIGDLDTHDQTCRSLCRELGLRVLSVAYRLAPEHPFPAAFDDGVACFRHAVGHADALGADPGAVWIGGDSAGGGIAAAVAIAARDQGGPVPARQLLIYPLCDLAHKRRSYTLFREGFFLTEAMLDRWAGHAAPPQARVDPRLSPIRTADLSGLAPAHVLLAGFDPLRDEGLDYAAALRAAGNEVTLTLASGLVHGFVNATGVSESAREALVEFCAAVNAR